MPPLFALRRAPALIAVLAACGGSSAALAQQAGAPYVTYERAVAAPAAPSFSARDSVEYAHDDGAANVNIGPPSSFNPDMLWGNYFETVPGGEVITSISAAFGATFPSLPNGPVTFWLLDDPDADFDPRNATALASVQDTPDVSGNDFFTVEIPPTRVSGAFFVGVSAFLQGGQDRPARVDTDARADRSWFFYAPDIAAVIDSLSTAPFGTRMDDPEFVPFPGAFMVRATGVAGAGPALALTPDSLDVELLPFESFTLSVTLVNRSGEDVAFTFPDFDGGPAPSAPPFVTDVDPATGTVAAGDSVAVGVTFSSDSLDVGVYRDTLTVEATEGSVVRTYALPVVLTVRPVVATEDGAAPAALALRPPYPNPFGAETTIAFALRDAADVTLAVYDALGRRVATLVEGAVPAGAHAAVWDARAVPSGVYVCRLQVGETVRAARLVVLR